VRVPTKSIVLMGGHHLVGGVCFDLDLNLYVAYNSVNKLVKIDFSDPYPGPDSILMSMNALGYVPHLEIESMTYYYSNIIDEGIIMLLKNGEVWHKSLIDFRETRWPCNPDGTPIPYPETAPYPPCLGAAGIEYHDGHVFLTFPQFNRVTKMAIRTLNPVAHYQTGVPMETPYPPTGISWDGVNSRWITIDPVKGDLVYGNPFDFTEGGREKYTYTVYNDCFDGDLAWSKGAIPFAAGKDFFVVAYKDKVTAFMEPWYRLFSVNDFTGVVEPIDGVLFDNVDVGDMVVKHLRLENMSNSMRQALTLSIVPDIHISADDDILLSISPTGPWYSQLLLGDFVGLGILDFYMRYYPGPGTQRGVYTVQLALNYTAS